MQKQNRTCYWYLPYDKINIVLEVKIELLLEMLDPLQTNLIFLSSNKRNISTFNKTCYKSSNITNEGINNLNIRMLSFQASQTKRQSLLTKPTRIDKVATFETTNRGQIQ